MSGGHPCSFSNTVGTHVLTLLRAPKALGGWSYSYTNQMGRANNVLCHQHGKNSSLEKDEWTWICASTFLDCHEEVFTFN